jgi:hypothetical protein
VANIPARDGAGNAIQIFAVGTGTALDPYRYTSEGFLPFVWRATVAGTGYGIGDRLVLKQESNEAFQWYRINSTGSVSALGNTNVPVTSREEISGGGATTAGGGIPVLYDVVGGTTGLEGGWDVANARVYPDTGAAAIAIGITTNQATNVRFPTQSATSLTAISNSTKIVEVPEPGDPTVAGSATIPFRPAAGALALSAIAADPNGIPTTATAVSLTVWPDQETRNNLNNVNQGYLASLQLIFTIDGTTPSWGTADLAPNGTPLKYGDRLILSRADAIRLRMLANSDTTATTPLSPGRPQVTYYGLEGSPPQHPIYQAYEWSLLNNSGESSTTTPSASTNRSQSAYGTTPIILASANTEVATIGSYSVQNDTAVAPHWVGFVEGNGIPTANAPLFFVTRNPGSAPFIINVGVESLADGKARNLAGGFNLVRSTNPLTYVAAPALAANSFVSVNYAQ